MSLLPKSKPKRGYSTADRIVWLRYKLEMLSKWKHELAVEWRCADREFQKLTLQQSAAKDCSQQGETK